MSGDKRSFDASNEENRAATTAGFEYRSTRTDEERARDQARRFSHAEMYGRFVAALNRLSAKIFNPDEIDERDLDPRTAVPLSIAFFSDIALLNLVRFMTPRDLMRYCRAEPAFAYKLCGSRKIPGQPPSKYLNMHDENVAWRVWKYFLERDYGLSVDAAKCSFASPLYQHMNSTALKAYLDAELIGNDLSIDGDDDQDENDLRKMAEREPNRARLRAYKCLYKILQTKTFALSKFDGDGRIVINAFSAAPNIVGLYIEEYNGDRRTLIVSTVALVNALIDLAGHPEEQGLILARLMAGRFYGFTKLLDEDVTIDHAGILVSRAEPQMRYIAAAMSNTSFATLDSADVADNADREFARIITRPLVSKWLLKPNRFGTAALLYVFFNYEGVDNTDETTHNELEIWNLVLQPDNSFAAPQFVQKVRLPLSDNDRYGNLRSTMPILSGATDQSYVTVKDFARRGQDKQTDDALFSVRLFARDTDVFSFRISNLSIPLAEHNRVVISSGVRRLEDGSVVNHVVFAIAKNFEPDLFRTPHWRSLVVIKVEINLDGSCRSAKLYNVPRFDPNILYGTSLSARHTAFVGADESFVFDWEQDTVHVFTGQRNAFLRGMQIGDRTVLKVGSLDLSNYHMALEERVIDDQQLQFSSIERYSATKLQAIDLLDPNLGDLAREEDGYAREFQEED